MQNNAIFYENVKPVKLRTIGSVDNRQSIRRQARAYVLHIQKTGNKVIRFYPLGKNMNSTACKFRLYVYNILLSTNNNGIHRSTDPEYTPYSYNEMRWIKAMHARLIIEGFSIVE